MSRRTPPPSASTDDLQPFGSPPAQGDVASAVERFEALAVEHGISSTNVLVLAQTFFTVEAVGEAPARALVEAVLSVAESEGASYKTLRADVIAAARARLGVAASPLRLADFTHAGQIPDWVYRDLPEPLSACCQPFGDGHPRDVFLTGALPVLSAAFPWLSFRYGHVWQRCNLFMMVVAESGAGKRPLEQAHTLIDRINEHLTDESELERSAWELAQESDDLRKQVGPEPPPWRRLSFAGDTSDAELFLSMHANGGRGGRGGHGVICESEIAVLAAAGGREWSNFRPKLLQGCSNETIRYDRKGRRPLVIRDSEIAISMSGTPRSFRTFIVDHEDGLFNRSASYTFDSPDEWLSGWNDDRDVELDEHLDALRRLLLTAYREMVGRRDDDGNPAPLFVRFSDSQKGRLDAMFEQQKAAFLALGYRPLATYTHRMALVALRIAAVLTVLRAAADGKRLSTPLKSVEVDEQSFRVGLQLAGVYTAHGLELARQHFRGVEEAPIEDKRREGHRRFFDAVTKRFGDAEFSRADAVAMAPDLGFSVRTGDTYLAHFLGHGLLSRTKAGLYYRTPLAPAPSPAEVRQMVDPRVPIGYVDPALLSVAGLGDPVADGGHDEPPTLSSTTAPPAAPEGAGSDTAPPSGDVPF